MFWLARARPRPSVPTQTSREPPVVPSDNARAHAGGPMKWWRAEGWLQGQGTNDFRRRKTRRKSKAVLVRARNPPRLLSDSRETAGGNWASARATGTRPRPVRARVPVTWILLCLYSPGKKIFETPVVNGRLLPRPPRRSGGSSVLPWSLQTGR